MAIVFGTESVAVIRVAGALRAPIGGDLARQVRSLLERGERRIVVHLGALSQIDAAGIGELVRAHNLARAAGGRLGVVAASGRIRALLARSGVLAFLDDGAESARRSVPAVAREDCERAG